MSEPNLQSIDQALASNDIRKAEVAIARLLRGNTTPKDRAYIFLRRAQARLLSGRPDEALEDIQTSVTILPDFESKPDTQMLFGDTYFARFELAEFGFADRANTEKALEYYNAIIESHPQFEKIGWVYYQRGRIFLSTDQTEMAIDDFYTSLTKLCSPPTLHAFCYERLGFIHLFDKREAKTALEFLDKAIQSYPVGRDAGWLVHVHVLRSRSLKDLGQNQEALVAAYRALDSLDPSTSDYRRALNEAHLAVGEVLALIQGREMEALEHLLQFLQTSKRPLGVDVTWSRVHETIGDLSLKLERYEQAIEAYQSSLQYNPYHPWEVNVHYQIARCYYRMRAYEQVVTSVDRMLKAAQADNQLVTDYRVFYVLANAYFALESYALAAEAYERAASLAPSNAANLDKIEAYLRFSKEMASKIR